MFTVYAIKSISRNYISAGLTNNLQRRLSGYNRTTKPYAPFVLIFQETFPTRKEARVKEKYLKSGVGKEYLKNKLTPGSGLSIDR